MKKRPTTFVFCVALALSLAAPALAATHKLYKPQPVAAGTLTYNKQGNIGNVLFSTELIKRDDTRAKAALKTLTFPVGKPPEEVFARAYLPASVSELTASVGHPTRNVQMFWKVWVSDGQPDDISQSALSAENGSWTACGWGDSDDSRFRKRLQGLKAGTYKIALNAYFDYDSQIRSETTGLLEWAHDSFQVAAGMIELVVKP